MYDASTADDVLTKNTSGSGEEGSGITPNSVDIKDKDNKRLVNFIINYLCKSKVLAKIDEESKENFAEELRSKYNAIYKEMFPESKISKAVREGAKKFEEGDQSIGSSIKLKATSLGKKLKGVFSRKSDEQETDENDGLNTDDFVVIDDTTTEDSDQEKLDALCKAVEKVTLDELEYEGSQLEHDIGSGGTNLIDGADKFGTSFASAKGEFKDRVDKLFTRGGENRQKCNTWDNILYIVWLSYAAHKCGKEVLGFVEAKLTEWLRQQQGHDLSAWWSRNALEYMDSNSFKLKKKAKPSGGGEGGAGGTGEVTEKTPFTLDDLQNIAKQIQSFTIETDLPGLEQSRHFTEWSIKSHNNNRKQTKGKAKKILQDLKNDLNPTDLNSVTDVKSFIKDLFAEGKEGSYYIYSNDLRVMILAITGNNAHIEQIYDRLINTVIGLGLKGWGKTQLDTIATEYFDTTTFTLKPAKTPTAQP